VDVDAALGLIVASVAATGLLAGASMDQSIKQLPARRQIGIVAYSDYSRAADLGNGIAWYAALGVGGGLLTLVAAVVGLLDSPDGGRTAALWTLIVLTIAHSAMTALAAPTNMSQRRAAPDEQALTRVFDRFVRLQTIRVTLQALTLVAAVWALVATISQG
jgi:hypothetical protein